MLQQCDTVAQWYQWALLLIIFILLYLTYEYYPLLLAFGHLYGIELYHHLTPCILSPLVLGHPL